MATDVRYAELRRKLAEHGWEVVHQDRDVEWWAYEIWTVKSTWAPKGFTLFLTWLRDPEDEGVVWGVGACLDRPTGRLEASGAACMSINGWPREVPEFLVSLATLRDEALRHST